jgi:hypothetical protein
MGAGHERSKTKQSCCTRGIASYEFAWKYSVGHIIFFAETFEILVATQVE